MIAGLVAFVFAPMALIISIRFDKSIYNWRDLFFDLFTLIVFGFLTPENWDLVLLLGLVVSLAPSISIQNRSTLLYSSSFVTLIVGMSISAMINSVPGWHTSIIMLCAICPIVIFYAHWQMQKADELRNKAKAHESLVLVAGGVAHDFNNILTAISGYSDIALSYLRPGDKAYQPLQSVIEATGRAAFLTRHLLSFAGRPVIEKTRLDPQDLLESTIKIAKTLILPGIEIRLSCGAGLPPILGDAGQLQQVFLNIILNAAEASSAPALIDVHLSHATKTVRFEILDHGCGIAPVDLGKIFDPFYTSKPKGHGLGLAAVKRILDFHEGILEITSELNEGTTVIVSLPSARTLANISIPEESTEPTVQRKTILIADDEESIRTLTRHMIEQFGFKALEAVDGTQCVTMYEQHKDELRAVILDLKMPGLDGWQCREHIRSEDNVLPILIVSGYNPGESTIIDDDRNTSFLAKPFRVQQLKESLSSLLLEDLS